MYSMMVLKYTHTHTHTHTMILTGSTSITYDPSTAHTHTIPSLV